MNIFSEVKEHLTARQAAEYYGLKVRRNGTACCPFHDDKHPSMKIDKNYHCFACGVGGDAVDYVSRMYGLSQYDAALKLIEDFTLPIDANLQWDGKSRIAGLLPRFLGADDNEYTREIMRLLMLAAVRRIYEPGCKFEIMVCLVGGQGAGKSTFFRFLAVNDEWFTDDLKRMDDENVYSKMQGHWIIEMSEMLATVNAKSIEDIKSFLSRQKETYRIPYQTYAEDRPRQCIFVGTSNNLDFLPLDRTGNRRFAPVLVHQERVERKMRLKKRVIRDIIFGEKVGDLVDTENQMELKRKETLEAIEKLCLFDDNLMTLVFDRNIEATELLLNTILQRNDLKVLEVVAQREYKNPMSDGRSITIDIYAKDGDDKVYDVEVQRASAGADVHRARFHSSMLDSKMLKAGQEFKEIHDSYVIFITASDVMRAGLSLYHINRVVEETGAYFGDGSHIIYVNGSYKDDNDPVGKLMHDFRCLSSADMFYPVLAKQIKYFKETEGGKEIMCQVFEDLAEKRIVEEKKASALRMIAKGKLTIEEIAEYTELTIEEVRDLAGLQLA